MATDIQPIQDILTRWILIGQALVGSIGALAFVVAFLWTKNGRFKAQTCVWVANRGCADMASWRRCSRPARKPTT